MRGNEPDQREQKNQNPKHNKKPPKNTPKTNNRNQADQAHVRSSLKRQKVQIRRPNTGVKRGDEFLSSRSQYRTSRTKLHSAYWQDGIPPEVHCVYVCMSKTESESEVQVRFFLRSKARRNLYQRMRTRQQPSECFQGDPYCVKNSSHLRDKISVSSCLWLGRCAAWDACRGTIKVRQRALQPRSHVEQSPRASES